MSGEVRVRRVSWWMVAALVAAIWTYVAVMGVATIRKLDAINADILTQWETADRLLKENIVKEKDRAGAPFFIDALALGSMFIAHAALKYFVFTLPGTAAFFGSLGLPPALGYLVFAAELVGGVAILAGVYARQVALALVPVLLGATWAHAGNGWLFNATGGGWEYPAFLSVAAIVQYLIGDGRYALRRAGR